MTFLLVATTIDHRLEQSLHRIDADKVNQRPCKR
jgi:hypothetical protein